MRLEDVTQVQELLSIFTQKVDLVFLQLQGCLLFGEILILLANDTHSTTDIVLLILALFAGQLVDKGLLDDLAGLEFLAVEDLAGFSHHGEVFSEDWMTTNV